MAFYMFINGKFHHHQFDFLEVDGGRRLDPTLAPRQKKPVKAEDSEKTFVIELMNRDVITLSSKHKAVDALKIFRKKRIHHLPITQEGSLVGMITDRDFILPTKEQMQGDKLVSDFMSEFVIACDEETPIDHLAKVFCHERINGMPIINSQHKLSGIITHFDLLKWIFDD